MPIYVKIDNIMVKPGSQPFGGYDALVRQVRNVYPRGADQVLVAESSKPFVRTVKTDKGIIAILIGLLLPAVQKLAESRTDVALLKGALRPGGSIGFAMGDGSVLPAPGQSAPQLKFGDITWD